MALLTGNLNLQGGSSNNPVPGVTQGNLLQGTGSINNASITPSVGVKAISPVNNIKKPVQKLPKTQIAPKDLSNIYGKSANGTIYNIKSQTAFSNPADFFKDSGQTSFDN